MFQDNLPSVLRTLSWSNRAAKCQAPGIGKPWTNRRSIGFLPSGKLLHSYWKWTIYSWFTHWKWWFSIVMLVYQRVIRGFHKKQHWFLQTWTKPWNSNSQKCSLVSNKLVIGFCFGIYSYRMGSPFDRVQLPPKWPNHGSWQIEL